MGGWGDPHRNKSLLVGTKGTMGGLVRWVGDVNYSWLKWLLRLLIDDEVVVVVIIICMEVSVVEKRV